MSDIKKKSKKDDDRDDLQEQPLAPNIDPVFAATSTIALALLIFIIYQMANSA